jgi:hypothetical protein
MIKRCALMGGFLLLGLSVSAFGNVGVCAPTATPDCTDATGLVQGGSAETIGINGTTFDIEDPGTFTSDVTWYLLLAIPDYTGSAPVLTSTGGIFTLSSSLSPNPSAGKSFTTSSSGSIFDLFGLTSNGSFNESNLFGTNEQSAFGSTPTSFDVFEYAFTPAFSGKTFYNFTVGGSGLPNGTFVGVSALQSDNSGSTPFTTAGLVNGPGCPDCGQGNQVPEPSQLGALFAGVGLIAFVQFYRRRQSA